MAKLKAKAVCGSALVLEFPRTGNPWIDAGTVGLYRVLSDKPAYADATPGPGADEHRAAYPDVKPAELSPDRLTITGPPDQVQACLEKAYDRLVAAYYNVSSQKQREDRGGWNFYLDSATDQFVLFPKKKSAGAASLLFDKAARPSGEQLPWGDGPDGRPLVGRLPPPYASLQSQLDELLARNKMKAGPPAGLLIDGENQVRPKVEIRAAASAAKAVCFLTGDPAAALVEAKETAFPLMGGSRSFISGTEDWPRLGWKADFAGKFVPALAFFYLQGDAIHLFFPQSNDLRRVDELADVLRGTMFALEKNLFRNFNFAPKTGGYFSRRSEVALAFLHCVFGTLTDQKMADQDRQEEARQLVKNEEPLIDDESAGAGTEVEPGVAPEAAPELLISSADVFERTQKAGPVGFAVVSAAKKGNVWMARDFWTFQDVVYLARLFAKMQRLARAKSGAIYSVCRPESLFRDLLDFEAKDEGRSLVRDRVSEAVLRRRPVLHLIERHAFHVNSHSDPQASRSVRTLLEFARLYEVEIRKGTLMGDEYQAMVKTATWLGDNVGKAVAAAISVKQEPESRGRAKGALFRLRKTRTAGDFMNELARLQLRYKIDVPRDVLDGETLNPESFEEFRGFCVVAALNRFLIATRESGPKAPTSN